VASNDPCLFERKRAEAETRTRIRDAAGQVKLATLPRRPQLAAPGSVPIPREVFVWLRNEKTGGEDWNVMVVGTLAALLLAFANRDASINDNARLVDDEDGPVIVVRGGVGEPMRFARGVGVYPFSDVDSSGFIRLRPALLTLARNDWLAIEVTAGETKLRLGQRAKEARGA
jgi:hypothetical protein